MILFFDFLIMYPIMELLKIIIILVVLQMIFDINLIEDIIINIQQYQIIKVLIDLIFIYSILNII
jgi:hypothetical protein